MTVAANCDSKLYEVQLPPQILARGFWLYLWKIIGPNNDHLCYVGMTGDVTGVAQSPFDRAAGHFGFNKKANPIRRHLLSRKIEPEECKSICFYVYGPIYPYVHISPRHESFDKSRARAAALEKRLWMMVKDAGYTMLNGQPGGKEFDEAIWQKIAESFAPLLDGS